MTDKPLYRARGDNNNGTRRIARARSSSNVGSAVPSALVSRVASVTSALDQAAVASSPYASISRRHDAPRGSMRSPLFEIWPRADSPEAEVPGGSGGPPADSSGGSSPSSSRVSLDAEVSRRADAGVQTEASPSAYVGRDMISDLKGCWIRCSKRVKKRWKDIPPIRAINVPYNGAIYVVNKGTGYYYNKRSDLYRRSIRKTKEAIDEIWLAANESAEEYCKHDRILKILREDYDKIDKQLKTKKGKLSENEIKELEKKRDEIKAQIKKREEVIHQEAQKDARLVYTKLLALNRARKMQRSNRWWLLAMFEIKAASDYLDRFIDNLIKAVLEDKW